MFLERFQNDNWQVIYFEPLVEEFSRRKGKTNILKLVNKKLGKKAHKDYSTKPLLPFSE